MTVHREARTDVVGSLLRPAYLAQARERLQAGRLTPAAFKAIEDRAVDQAIALQEGIGLDVVTDGEMRRFSFFEPLMFGVHGLTEKPGIPVHFRRSEPGHDEDVQFPLAATERIGRKRTVAVEEFAYARARARTPVKALLPSPMLMFMLWSPEHSREAYPDPFELFADGAALMREEAQELAAIGCEYIQVDAPELAEILADETQRAMWDEVGIGAERALTEGVELIDSVVADLPNVTTALHLCKGNYGSKWIASGGYEQLASRVLERTENYDRLLLEYDDERSGSFEPLAAVPDHMSVVLGLISSKVSELEAVEQIVGRIEEASRFVSRDQLAVSTQCGFASVAQGNELSLADQEAKLRLVVDVAHQVWG